MLKGHCVEACTIMKLDMIWKRLIVFILSIAGGIGLTFGLLYVLDLAYHRVNYEVYGPTYFTLTAIPLMFLCGVWLDYFMGTKFLSEPEDQAKA